MSPSCQDLKTSINLFSPIKDFLQSNFGIRFYRNSLPRGVSLFDDINRINKSEICEIWDIGAHKGETTLEFSKVYKSATIRSFEPVSENFAILNDNCSHLKNQYSHKIALGNSEKEVLVHLQKASVNHSLRDDLNSPIHEGSHSEKVSQKTIDSLLSKFSCKGIDLLKIDVEGYEKSVIEGAKGSLKDKRINFIFIETGLDHRFNSISSLSELLSPMGYLPYGFYDQNPHWTGTQNLWYWNTLFVRADFL